MLCQVAECKLNVTPDWCSFIVCILYNPRKCTIFYEKRSATFYTCGSAAYKSYYRKITRKEKHILTSKLSFSRIIEKI